MQKGQIRIIAGKWRGRKIIVPDVVGLRPTTDQIRETLFNWLQPIVAGTRCLDLYAGTGALGFEALSRGAVHVMMIEKTPAAVKNLHEQAAHFDLMRLEIIQGDALSSLNKTSGPFDLVFLDPPFSENLLLPACTYLEKNNFLARLAHIYLESAHEVKAEELPASWEIIKSKKTGNVFYYLAKRTL